MNGMVDRTVYRLARTNTEISCRIIKETLNIKVSESTISRRLHKSSCAAFSKEETTFPKSKYEKKINVYQNVSQ